MALGTRATLATVALVVFNLVDATVAQCGPGDPHPEDTVFVHLQSFDAVRLEGRSDDQHPWQLVCRSICDAPVPEGWEYRVVGDRFTEPSNAFRLNAWVWSWEDAGRPVHSDRIVLTVNPRSQAAHQLWDTVGVAGVFAMVIGVVGVGVGIAAGGADVCFKSCGDQGPGETYFIAGAALVATGIGAAIAGFTLAASSGKSEVTGAPYQEVRPGKASPPAWSRGWLLTF